MHIIKIEKNKIIVNEKEIVFQNRIDRIVEFSEYCILLFMDDVVPDNNVEAYDYNGNRVWNISQIIQFSYPECYIALSKETDNLFSVITYNGVKFIIDTSTYQIVNRSITK